MTTAQPYGMSDEEMEAAGISLGGAQPGQEQRMVTDAMIKAAKAVPIMCETYSIDADDAEAIYTAMRTARPTADLGEDGELVEALGDVLDIIAAAQAEFSRTDEHKAYYNKRHDQVQQARDRLILYREALEEIANPLAAMQRRAAAEGNRLSGMANQIANDPEQLKQIARAVLSRSGG